MNQDVISMIEKENFIEMAKDKIKERQQIEERKNREFKERLDQIIKEAHQNYSEVLNAIIMDVLESYLRCYGYDFAKSGDESFFKDYSLKLCTTMEKANSLSRRVPYEMIDYINFYNINCSDDREKIYYFIITKKNESIQVPVIFDIRNMESINLFNLIGFRDNTLTIMAYESNIEKLLIKAYNGELDGKYDEKVVDLLKNTYIKAQDKKLMIETFIETIRNNAKIIYKDIYRGLLDELSKKVCKDKYEVTIKMKDVIDSEKRKLIKNYYLSKYCSDDNVINCVHESDGIKTELLVSEKN